LSSSQGAFPFDIPASFVSAFTQRKRAGFEERKLLFRKSGSLAELRLEIPFLLTVTLDFFFGKRWGKVIIIMEGNTTLLVELK